MTGCLDPNIIPTLTQLKKLELHFYSSNAHLEKINYLTNLIDFQCHGPLRIEHISNLTNLESFTLNSMSEIYIRELGHFSNLTFLDIEAFPSNRYWLGELCVLPKLKSLNVDKIIINSGLTKFLNKNFSPALILNGMRVSYYFEDLYYIEGRRIMQKR
ncbi:MAG: hypothetical protein Hyperionvirus23_22 [Hyperionvirus sp.]|uniref:Uncharacterized protein n=1 Tax=Hyperionvirus sp. TaxID=2487770 RepID=A0A3G5AAV0_9VIRU|nr:MAG: hypothetical protein Hyperionvirus23_22 [Hyperionvirus sp.]